MKKRVAVVAVNPVNGSGLFQYLEAFYEHQIPYTVFAIAPTKDIKTNSGIKLQVDDVIGNLKGHEDEFDALVFACGDAIPVFAQHAEEEHNQILLKVITTFAHKNKIIIGHCAAALIFEKANITQNKKLAVHRLAQPAIQKGIATNNEIEIDNNFYTAQDENKIALLLPSLLPVLID